MILFELDGTSYANMVAMGSKNLLSDIERVNALNVFPVPDGDTGTNMRMTIEGGVEEGLKTISTSIAEVSKLMSRAMTLNARGNSGVILSQYFRGISQGLDGLEKANVKQFGEALVSGTKRAYKVVQNPTEGTILTVVREAGEAALNDYKDGMNLTEYLNNYVKYAHESLARTPDLLPVLKKAGVVDSGAVGLILIFEGFIKYLNEEEIILSDDSKDEKKFGVDSKLINGFSIDFSLQLQNSKIDVTKFNLKDFNSILNGLGTNLITNLNDTLLDAHINTFHPGTVICQIRKFGEITKIKILNLDIDEIDDEIKSEEPIFAREHKKYATVAVANGAGLVQAFRDMGVDEVVSGGQTMNTSTQDFIKAFNSLNAENIFVFPNNSNIVMAAEQAAKNYDKANIYVVKTKTIAEGYSACQMINFDSDDIDTILNEFNEVISNVSTLEVTYSIRDTNINDLIIKKGDFICIYNGNLISASKDRISAIKQAFRAIPDFNDKSVLTVLCGIDVRIEETQEIEEIAKAFNSYIEVYPVEGNQDVYSYIIGIE